MNGVRSDFLRTVHDPIDSRLNFGFAVGHNPSARIVDAHTHFFQDVFRINCEDSISSDGSFYQSVSSENQICKFCIAFLMHGSSFNSVCHHIDFKGAVLDVLLIESDVDEVGSGLRGDKGNVVEASTSGLNLGSH